MVTVMSVLPVPELADTLYHDGVADILQAPFVVILIGLIPPSSSKLSSVGVTLKVGVGVGVGGGASAAAWLSATSAGVAPDTVMVSFPLRMVDAVFAEAITVMVALPVPEVADTEAHEGAPVKVHAPLVVMTNVLDSPAAV